MAVISIPSDILSYITRQTLGNRHFNLAFASDLTGASQSRLLAPQRWLGSFVSAEKMEREAAAAWRAFVLSLEGQVNQLAFYDLYNTAPRGTYRGTPTLSGNVAVGDRTIPIVDATQGTATWKKGDWIGLGQSGSERQLFAVMADAAAVAGAVSLTVWPPAKFAVASGQAATWDKPTCLMRRTTDESMWDISGELQGGFSLDLRESWE
jgi:hypothetical protein